MSFSTRSPVPAHRSPALLRRSLALASAGLLLATALVVSGEADAVADQQDAACGTANIAQGRPATASSTENAGVPAAAAVDGNPGTRWGSAFSDPQWLQID